MARLVIFDLDGVLIDSEGIAAEVLSRVLTEDGYPVSFREVAERFIGIGIPAILREVARVSNRIWPSGYQDSLEQVVRQEVYARLKLIDGMHDLLLLLPSGSWCIGSNSDVDRIERCLDLAGISSRFQPRIFSGSNMPRGKPAPDLFLAAANAFDISPRDCIVIEDTVVGIIAGRSAGMHVIGFTGGSHWHGMNQGLRLKEAGADMIVADVAELSAALSKLDALPKSSLSAKP